MTRRVPSTKKHECRFIFHDHDYLLRMGQTIEPESEVWTAQEWVPIDTTPQHSRTATLRNLRTGSLADEYYLSWSSHRDFEFYLKSFNWRNKRQNSSAIVTSIGLKNISNSTFCNTKYTANIYL